MQGGKREAVPRDALTGTGGRASTGTTGTSASSSAVNRVDSSGVEPRNSALTTAISSTVVQLAFVRRRDRRRITFSTYRLLAICTRTGAWTRGPPSPDLWIHRITWNSRVCWEAGRPVSDSSNAASALLWCEFNLLFFFYIIISFCRVVKATGKSFGKFVKIVENFYQGVDSVLFAKAILKDSFFDCFFNCFGKGIWREIGSFCTCLFKKKICREDWNAVKRV